MYRLSESADHFRTVCIIYFDIIITQTSTHVSAIEKESPYSPYIVISNQMI